MNEQITSQPDMHQIVEDATRTTFKRAGIPEQPRMVIGGPGTVTADKDGEHLRMDLTRSPLAGDVHTDVQIRRAPLDSQGNYQPQIRPEAALSQNTSQQSGEQSSLASAQLPSGDYQAVTGKNGVFKAHVACEGYGLVELKNPRAGELVASLAAKAVKRTQDAMGQVRPAPPKKSLRQRLFGKAA